MALKLSTALRNRILGEKSTVTDAGSQIAFANATSKVTDTQNRFLDAGFRPDDIIEVTNSASGTNDGYYSVTSVATDGSEMVISPAPTDEAAGAATPTIACVHGKAWRDLFLYGILVIYTGSQPADADAAETGTKLVEITDASGAFTKGTKTNGLECEVHTGIASGKVEKKNGQTWSGQASATGTAGWFRFHDNAYATGADASAEDIRFDGACGVSGAQLNMSSTSISSGATITIDTFDVTEPAS